MSQETGKPSTSDDERLVHVVSSTPWIAGTVLVVLVVAYMGAFYQNGWAKSPEVWGQLGDYIGGLLNPLVAWFALLALVASVRFQKAELAATREELKESRKAMQEQAKTAEQQRSEQRFFDLLNIYQESLKTFTFENMSGKSALTRWSDIAPGSFACKNFLKTGNTDFYSSVVDYVNMKETDLLQKIIDSWGKCSSIFEHYFRTIGSIAGEIENLLKEDHWRYAKLFRAQLSRDEVNLLAFNVLLNANGKKMRPLVAKYGLLKHLSFSPLRTYAEQELDPLCFGRKWAAAHPAMPSEETQPC